MNKTQVFTRIEELCNAHAWSLENGKMLNDAQRICLTMERASLMRLLPKFQREPNLSTMPKYWIPDHLNEKVKHISTIIKNTNYVRPFHRNNYE